MKLSLNIIDWQAAAPGLASDEQWRDWSLHAQAIDPSAPLAKPTALPMMTARRLSSGSKLAVECGLTLLRRQPVDAVLFTSRHGELERNFRLLQALATEQPLSPTDFALSVHNSSVGNLTIAAQQPLVSSSLSAGRDTFQQGLCEAIALIHAGYRRVLLVDFDGELPAFYHPHLPPTMPTWPYAVGLVLQAGDTWRCQTQPGTTQDEPALPQSLLFLRHYLQDARAFTVDGERMQWCWSRT